MKTVPMIEVMNNWSEILSLHLTPVNLHSLHRITALALLTKYCSPFGLGMHWGSLKYFLFVSLLAVLF